MKKLVSLLLVFVMLLGVLCSCNNADKNTNIPSDDANTPNSEDKPSDEVNKPSEEENKPNGEDKPNDEENTVIPSPEAPAKKEYFDTEYLSLGKHRYTIYNKDGNAVLTKETDKPLTVSMLTDSVVSISIGMGTGISLKTYYNVETNTFSEEYCYVIATSDKLIAYLDGDLDERVLIVKSIFGNDFYQEFFDLEFAKDVMPVYSADFIGGNLHLSYHYKGDAKRTLMLGLFEQADYDYFTDYNSVVELVDRIYRTIPYYNDHSDYAEIFGITDEENIESFDALFVSMLSFYPPHDERGEKVTYAIKDLNLDGIFELVFLNEDYEIIAIFSTNDEKPVLLDNFWNRRKCRVDYNSGWLYISGSNGADAGVLSIYKIAQGGASTELIVAYGYDGPAWTYGYSVEKYYKIVNDERIPITEEEYKQLGRQYPNFRLAKRGKVFQKIALENREAALKANAKQAFVGALKNEIKVYDSKSGEACYLTDYKTTNNNLPLSQIDNLSYLMMDLDGDKISELIIDCGDILVLRYYEGLLYVSFENKPESEAEFYTLELPWVPKVSPEEAFDIANRFSGKQDGFTEGAAGTTLTHRLLLRNHLNDDIRYYHFLLVREASPNMHPAELEDGGGVYNLDHIAEMVVDSMTGECKPYEPPTYAEEDYGK